MTSIDEIVKELSGLMEKATPGPWVVKPMHGYVTDQIESSHPDYASKWPARYVTSFEGPGEHWEANRDFVVAVHTHLPALLSALARSRRMEEALRRIGSGQGFPYVSGEEKLRHVIMYARAALEDT